ncbi:MFS transporter [Tolypothrix sp. FACHB-123]|uniref:MFS transporter n=1 Tax=Tolypothrix sp. FACHB-123 TaxID=2692868 RepID=UPI001684141A|nr:MFS transporter [Tolypothrix sp. FACHB-123]MBD2356708.1 MFS transporter [Tolypothrix sp. FACHB-123]
MVKSYDARTEILWQQVWGLAALLAAVIFSWIVYSFYQPKILHKLEFAELASWLGIIPWLLATVIEPIIGKFSDRLQQFVGNRLPIISIGVTLAGLILAIISLLVEQDLPEKIRWFVPVLMTFWLIVIIIFRSPAIALLIQFAPISELPQANAVLVFVFGFVAALEPLLRIFLNNLGASITFLLAAITLMMGAYILRSLVPLHTWKPYPVNEEAPNKAPTLLLILLFVVGLGTGLEVNLLMSIFPQELQSQFPAVRLEFITSGILIVCAIAAVIFGEWTAQIGANKALLLGLGSLTGLMGLALLNDIDTFIVGYIFAFGVSFSLIFVSMIPFCLGKLAPHQAGLATGLFFGGAAGAMALVSLLVKQAIIGSLGAFLLSEVAFFVVAGCVAIAKKIQIS